MLAFKLSKVPIHLKWENKIQKLITQVKTHYCIIIDYILKIEVC